MRTKIKDIAPDINRHPELKQDLSKALEVILSPEETFNYVPYELRKQKKKKRKSH